MEEMALKTRALSILVIIILLVISSATHGSSLETMVMRADAHYSARAQTGEAEKALAILTELERAYPNSAQVLWRVARICYWMGSRVYSEDKRVKLEYLERGKTAAEKATTADPREPLGFYWLSACIGEIGKTKGILNSLFMVNPMKQALDKVIALDPNHAGAHYVLSELYRQVPGPPISIGNKQRALQEAKLAVQLGPMEASHWLALGKAYTALRDYAEARKALNQVLTLPVSQEDPQGHADDVAEARAELKAIEGK